MARIRTVKPEFFTSEDIVSLSPFARLFYIALWCEADREGRLKWQKKTLKMRYLPDDDCDIDELSKELEDADLVIPYEIDGKKYAYIPGFSHHQVINNRESESIIPAPLFDASTTRESAVKAEGKEGREGKGREGKVKQQRFVPPTKEEVEQYGRDINFGIDGGKFVDYYSSKGWMIGKNKMKDWKAAVRTWKRRDDEEGKPQTTGGLARRSLN